MLRWMSLEQPSKAVLVGVQLPGVTDEEHASSLAELARLAKTLGLSVVGRISQKRQALAAAAVVGEGKLKELARLTGGSGVVPSGVPAHRVRTDDAEDEDPDDATEIAASAGIVLVDHDLSPSQARNLERATRCSIARR